MEIVELILDEENEYTGVNAISLVSLPAIEEDWIALSKEKVQFAKVDEERRVLMGAALVPNKPIYRRTGEREFYVFFSKETIRKTSELFFKKNNHVNATLEHEADLDGLTVIESWIVEDTKKDKSALYGMNYKPGTWVVSMKVDDLEIWEDYVKTGEVKGFSIEGYYADKSKVQPSNLAAELSLLEDVEAEYLLKAVNSIVRKDKRTKSGTKITFESFNDYPQSVVNNAKNALKKNEDNGGKCMTLVGKNRAQDLSKKRKLSVETLKRTYSYLSRAKAYADAAKDPKDCAKISYNGWGGASMLSWTKSKLNGLGFTELSSMVISEDVAIIDNQIAFNTVEKAEAWAKELGCKGHHTHEYNGALWYMACEKHLTQNPE